MLVHVWDECGVRSNLSSLAQRPVPDLAHDPETSVVRHDAKIIFGKVSEGLCVEFNVRNRPKPNLELVLYDLVMKVNPLRFRRRRSCCISPFKPSPRNLLGKGVRRRIRGGG